MTVIWIILAALAAASVALFQYGYILKHKKTKKKPWLALLRFLTVFCLLILLIAPKISTTTYTSLLPQLVIMVDDSRSIEALEAGDDVQRDLNQIRNHPTLKENFDIQVFSFTDKVKALDSLSFDGSETDIAKAIQEPQQLYRDRHKAIVLMTDGNQTAGSSYQYQTVDRSTQLYPIIYGDTTSYPDLKIQQVNVNRYSYLNNEFPVEVLISYQGNESITETFTITNGNTTLYTQNINFSKEQRSAVVNTTLVSKSIGTQRMKATITHLAQEKNTGNNSRNFAVEVIDQQTKIALLHNGLHPDLGAIKKAIESNQQREVDLLHISELPDLNEYQLVIRYGVGPAFAKADAQVKLLNKNTWTFTGPLPNLSYFNSLTEAIQLENEADFDEVQPILNDSYPTFNLESFDYTDFPPVSVPFGELTTQVPISVLFFKQISNIRTTQPFWFTYEEGETRHAVTLAAGLWKWRAQSYINNKEFVNFDDLINSQVQYLASNKKRNRLDVSYEPFYYQNQSIRLNAQYLDKNYQFEDNGILNLKLKELKTGEVLTRPFILDNFSYQVDLSGLEAGDYSFLVQVENDKLNQSGSFTVLEFDIEQQFVSASAGSMQQLVGPEAVWYPNQINALVEELTHDPLLQTVERATVSQTSLVDWKYLLGIIILLLALEWFARKYQGLV
ncbi:vWA domain-containing protein [Nonlabens xiamenensis]|uniref:vWA domain-containing protein n=1 Tax=Nonlabens xiamenensis TaxID=2341043 RepID=UPI000F60FDDC|nr:vWA domain-containing protein [Nonlabens xiamenensis]